MTCPQCRDFIEWSEQHVYGGTMPTSNKETIRDILANLHKHAEKGNWAHNDLVMNFGHHDDYDPRDWGNEPTDTNYSDSK